MNNRPHAAPTAEAQLDAGLDALVQTIDEFARHRPGRLAAVSIRAPAALLGPALTARLAARLAAVGLADVAVHAEWGDAFQLTSVEYDR